MMVRYFFDTSALVKHYHAEAGTETVDRLIDEPGAELLIARLTLVETISVFAIKVRAGEFDARTGAVKAGPAKEKVGTYRVEVAGGEVRLVLNGSGTTAR